MGKGRKNKHKKKGTPVKPDTPAKVEEVKHNEPQDKENIFPTFPENSDLGKTSILNETFEEKPVRDISDKQEVLDNTSDKYSSIALLDDEQEEEKWEERTAVITKNDHEGYLSAASSILQEVLQDVKTPVKRAQTETPPEDEATNISSQTGFASANTSLVSTYRTMDSDSEADYESATENEASFAVGESNDDSEIEFGNKLLDAVDITDNGEDIEAALENLKIQVVADKEKTPRQEEQNIRDVYVDRGIIHTLEETNANHTDEEKNVNDPCKENSVKLGEVCGDLSTEKETTLVSINEVTKEDEDLNIKECQADQVINTEADKTILNSSEGTSIRPDESGQNILSPLSKDDTSIEKLKIDVSKENDDPDILLNTAKDDNIPIEKNAVNLEANPTLVSDISDSENVHILEDVNAGNCENQILSVQDQENILDAESEELKNPIKSSEKAEAAETLPTSKLDHSCSETVESVSSCNDGLGLKSANIDPMDDLLSGFEKIKIAATPKPSETSKLFDYNISTGEIEEVKQILEPIVEQRLKIDFEESDNVNSDNLEEQKERELREYEIQGKICKVDSVSESEVSLTKKVNDDSLVKETCNESTSETQDVNTITNTEVISNIVEIENKLDILKEDESNVDNADKNTIDVLQEPSSDLLEINSTESSTSLDSAVKPSEDQITKNVTNTSEVTASDKGKEIAVENETSEECQLMSRADLSLISDNSVKKVFDGESIVQMNNKNPDTVNIHQRSLSEEAHFDSLPDLEHIESHGVTNTFSGHGYDDHRNSVDLEIPLTEDDTGYRKEEEQQKQDIDFLPPPPPSLLSFPPSDTPDLPDPPSDSECLGHKLESATEFPEPPREEELRIIESNGSEEKYVPSKEIIEEDTSVPNTITKMVDETQDNDIPHTIPSLAVPPHLESSDSENIVPSEGKIHLASPSVPVQLSRSSPSMSKPTAVVKPCKTSDLNTTEADLPYQACGSEDTGKSADLAVSPAGIACTVVHGQVNSDTLANKDTVMDSEEDLPVPPAKGYNLDFLDQLDDPNFNPFETKTAVKNQFEATECVQESTESIDKNSVSEKNSSNTNISEEKTPKDPASIASADDSKEKSRPTVKPKKPLIRKTIKPKKPEEPKKSPEPTEDTKKDEAEDDDTPLPPAKSYNLDFLDKLDDPNFNPFETKTAVQNHFETTESAPTPVQNNEIKDDKHLLESEVQNKEVVSEVVEEKKVEKVKKPLPKKPWLNKTKKKAAPIVKSDMDTPGESEQTETEDVIPVPSKGYNLDFLDNLDDPNFNPFETKTAVKNQFDATESLPVQDEANENKENILHTISNTEVKKAEDDTKDVSEEKKVEKVKKPLPKKPWLNKTKKKPPPKVEAEPAENEDIIPVPTKGYNLDFLDKLDDPNFNPFETKTAVVNNFDENSPVIESSTVSAESNGNAIAKSNNYKEKNEKQNEDIETVNIGAVEEKKNENVKKEKKPKKALPPKPWLKKGPKTKVAEEIPEEEKEAGMIVPSKGYNFEVLDNLDDPNFNPFETKSSIVNNFETSVADPLKEKSEESDAVTSKVQSSELISGAEDKKTEELSENTSPPIEEETVAPKKNYNLDFLDKMDDPNFDPFSTKTKVVDDVSVGHGSDQNKTCSEPQVVKDSTPEFEQNEAQIGSSDSESMQTCVPKEPGVTQSPKSLTSGYSSLPKSTQLKLSQAMEDDDFSFCLPEPVNVEKWMSESKEHIDDIEQMSLSTSSEFSLNSKEPKPSVPQNPGHNLNLSLNSSTLVSQAVDAPINHLPSTEGLNYKDLSSMVNGDVSNLAKLGLLHEARLLDKDKELSRIAITVKEKQNEIDLLKHELQQNTESNKQMMMIVEEFEKTIGQLIAEKEREQVCHEIERDRVQNERNQILEDLQAVERAFNDLHRKYERTKEVVAGFKTNEDVLKSTVEELSNRYKKGEERYELLKTHAETKLNEANSRIAEIQRSKSAEIAKLTALLRKAEMRVASLERSLEQKTRENQELTTICDELIGKVGS